MANSFSSGAGTSISAGTLTREQRLDDGVVRAGGGVLGGTGSVVRVGGASSWLAGTQTGTGTTRYDGALALTGAGARGSRAGEP